MQSTEKLDDVLSQFSLNIFRMNGILMRSGDRITHAINQSSARWQVLGRVGYEPQTVANIARDMGHSRQSVQRIANVLVNEGLTCYKPNPSDRRAQLLELTPQGLEVLTAIYKRLGEWSHHIMTKLDPMQLAILAEGL